LILRYGWFAVTFTVVAPFAVTRCTLRFVVARCGWLVGLPICGYPRFTVVVARLVVTLRLHVYVYVTVVVGTLAHVTLRFGWLRLRWFVTHVYVVIWLRWLVWFIYTLPLFVTRLVGLLVVGWLVDFVPTLLIYGCWLLICPVYVAVTFTVVILFPVTFVLFVGCYGCCLFGCWLPRTVALVV